MHTHEIPLIEISRSIGKPDPLEPTIFHEKWWLDVTTRGQCQFAEVTGANGVVARLPFLVTKVHGLKTVDLPPLTHFLGPAIMDGEGKGNKRFLRRLDLTAELIDRLPRTSSLYVKCHREVTDVLAFQTKGFRSSVQFTHEVHPQPIEDVWKGMRDKGRNGIRLAREACVLQYDLSAKEFASAYDANLDLAGHRNTLDMEIVTRLVDEALARNRGTLFGVRDTAGRLVSAIFCVWDRHSYYYLMSTRTATAHRGAISLLLWEAISDAMRRGLIFDFDGAINEGGARLAANFTATVTPRYIAIRESDAMRVLRALRSVRRKPNYFCQ